MDLSSLTVMKPFKMKCFLEYHMLGSGNTTGLKKKGKTVLK